MNCEHDEALDNMILYPVAFASKSLSSAEWQYSSIEREPLLILHGLKNFITTALCRK